MNNRSTIHIELFLEPGCRGSSTVLNVVNTVAETLELDVQIWLRDRDAAEFMRRGVLICPATFIAGRLAFYGPITDEDIHAYLQKHKSNIFNTTGETV